jgi:hypothetical protein
MTYIVAILQLLAALAYCVLVFANSKAGNHQATMGWLCALIFALGLFFRGTT